ARRRADADPDHARPECRRTRRPPDHDQGRRARRRHDAGAAGLRRRGGAGGPMTIAAVIVTLVLSLPFLVVLVHRPVLRRLAVPRSQVIGVDFGAARRFGGDPAATGMSGPTPPIGHAAITTDLARALDVRAGKRVAVFAYGTRTALVVDRILPRRGVAGFSLGADQESRNVLVSPQTFDRISAGTGSGAPPSWSIAVSDRGGVENGVGRTDEGVAAVR